jgi:hypothetical protein
MPVSGSGILAFKPHQQRLFWKSIDSTGGYGTHTRQNGICSKRLPPPNLGLSQGSRIDKKRLNNIWFRLQLRRAKDLERQQ